MPSVLPQLGTGGLATFVTFFQALADNSRRILDVLCPAGVGWQDPTACHWLKRSCHRPARPNSQAENPGERHLQPSQPHLPTCQQATQRNGARPPTHPQPSANRRAPAHRRRSRPLLRPPPCRRPHPPQVEARPTPDLPQCLAQRCQARTGRARRAAGSWRKQYRPAGSASWKAHRRWSIRCR